MATEPHEGRAIEQGEHPIVRLARSAVESFVLKGVVIDPPAVLTPEMTAAAGVFVSIKKRGELRGCIGTFEPVRGNVAEEVIHNAVSSATCDRRFPPIHVHELSSISFSVDVLSPPEPVESIAQLDPGRYGVIVSCGTRRGLLLPALEGVETAERQVAIARAKAGIAGSEPAELRRFEVRRYR